MHSPVSNVGHLVEREGFLRVALMAVVTVVSIGVHGMWPRGFPALLTATHSSCGFTQARSLRSGLGTQLIVFLPELAFAFLMVPYSCRGGT